MFPADHVHPEFGYCCPSQNFRRKARVAFTFITLGVIVGALALRGSHETGSESVVMLALVDKAPPGSETISTVVQSTAISAAEGFPVRERTACQEDIYSDGECATGKVQKRRRVRAANDAPPIAAVALGRSALSLPDTSPPPPKSTDPAEEATIAPPVTTEQVAAVNEGGTPEVTTGQRADTPRKVRKALANQNKGSWRDERWRGDAWSARAYAQPNYGNSRYQYARSWSGGSW
jgi:hypothetical protein